MITYPYSDANQGGPSNKPVHRTYPIQYICDRRGLYLKNYIQIRTKIPLSNIKQMWPETQDFHYLSFLHLLALPYDCIPISVYLNRN